MDEKNREKLRDERSDIFLIIKLRQELWDEFDCMNEYVVYDDISKVSTVLGEFGLKEIDDYVIRDEHSVRRVRFGQKTDMDLVVISQKLEQCSKSPPRTKRPL